MSQHNDTVTVQGTAARLKICVIVVGHGEGRRREVTARPQSLDRSVQVSGMPLLAALTPAGHEVTIVHDNGDPAELERLRQRYDAIGLTATPAQRDRVVELLRRLRGCGAKICVAGSLVAADEAAVESLCNVRFVGALDETWPRFVDDLASGRRTLRRYPPLEVPHIRSLGASLAGTLLRWMRTTQRPVLARPRGRARLVPSTH